MKSTKTYWNPLDPKNTEMWEEIAESNGNLKQLTLAIDTETGDYTSRLLLSLRRVREKAKSGEKAQFTRSK